MATPEENDVLKRLSRRRRRRVDERTRVLSAMQTDLQAPSSPWARALADHRRCRQLVVPELSDRRQGDPQARPPTGPDAPRQPAQAARHRPGLGRLHPGLAARPVLWPRRPPGRRHDPPGRHADPRVEPPDQGLATSDRGRCRQLRDRRSACLDPRLRRHLERRAGRRDRHHRTLPERGQPRLVSRHGTAR